MTHNPKTIDCDAGVIDVLDLRYDNRFRHLPVMSKGALVGMLSTRDLPLDHRIMRNNWLAAKVGAKVLNPL